MPNSSMPSTASRAPIIRHGCSSATARADRVNRVEDCICRRVERAKPRIRCRPECGLHPCSAARSSPATPVRPVTIANTWGNLRWCEHSIRSRRLMSAKAIDATPSPWIAIVSTMSARPQAQFFSNGSVPLNHARPLSDPGLHSDQGSISNADCTLGDGLVGT